MGKIILILLGLLVAYLLFEFVGSILAVAISYFIALPLPYKAVVILGTVILFAFFVALVMFLKAKKRPILIFSKKYNTWAGIKVCAFTVLYPIIHSFIAFFIVGCFVKDETELINLGAYLILVLCVIPVFLILTITSQANFTRKHFDKFVTLRDICEDIIREKLDELSEVSQAQHTEKSPMMDASALAEITNKAKSNPEAFTPQDIRTLAGYDSALPLLYSFLKYEYESFDSMCTVKQAHYDALDRQAKEAEKVAQAAREKARIERVCNEIINNFAKQAKCGQSSGCYFFREKWGSSPTDQERWYINNIKPRLEQRGFKNVNFQFDTDTEEVMVDKGESWTSDVKVGTISDGKGNSVDVWGTETHSIGPTFETEYYWEIRVTAEW